VITEPAARAPRTRNPTVPAGPVAYAAPEILRLPRAFRGSRKGSAVTREAGYCGAAGCSGRSIRQLLVAVTYTLPLASVILASASAVRRPK